jgi:hypothetical protein
MIYNDDCRNVMIYNDDCRNVLSNLPDASIDALITDPPYPCSPRPYGTWTEDEWHSLMDEVVVQAKRLLKPTGSAVFILQPNSKRVGKMRLWLWEFLLRTAKSWNLIQDVYWWNHTALPGTGCPRQFGLCRPSVKYCLWFGAPNCYRNQDEVLWTPSDATHAIKQSGKALQASPSGHRKNANKMAETALSRGGSTPFNLLLAAHTQRPARWI